ncbi:pol, partial [Symbiodinium sp. CCMP2456]
MALPCLAALSALFSALAGAPFEATHQTYLCEIYPDGRSSTPLAQNDHRGPCTTPAAAPSLKLDRPRTSPGKGLLMNTNDLDLDTRDYMHTFPPGKYACYLHTDGLMTDTNDLSLEAREDTHSLMQTTVPDRMDRWAKMLDDLRHDLEMLDKADRAEAAVQLLRWLDFRATNSEEGYWLGHMRGRPADLTALLVVALADTGVDPDTLTNPWCSSWVLETRRRLQAYIPCHEGSNECWGRPISTGMPPIMHFGRPPPTSTPPSSPGLSAVVEIDEEEPCSSRPKRRCLTLELSSGSADRPRFSRTLTVPLRENEHTFQLRVSVGEQDDSEASTRLLTPAPRREPAAALRPAAFRLPDPAPGDLAAAGLSMRDLLGLWSGWRSGALQEEDIERVHGQAAARFVREHWGYLPHEAYVLPTLYPDQTEADDLQVAPSTTADAAPNDEEPGAGDETALLMVFVRVFPALAAVGAWIARLRRQGLENVLLTSFLLVRAQERECYDYMDDWEGIMLELGLEPEGDFARIHEVPPDVQEMLLWVEAEMWDDFVDRLESLTGWESDQVMNARARPNMDWATRAAWRQRALGEGEADPPLQTAPAAPQEAAEETDASAFMERYRQRGDRRRDESRDPAPPRGRPLRDGNRRSGDAHQDARSRTAASSRGPRCTEETRRLEPRTPRARPSTTTRAAVPFLSVDAAVAQWLYFFGLRRGPDTTELAPALPREDMQRRIDWLATLHEQDLATAMTGFLRVLAMLMVECSQMILTHQATFLVAVDL